MYLSMKASRVVLRGVWFREEHETPVTPVMGQLQT